MKKAIVLLGMGLIMWAVGLYLVSAVINPLDETKLNGLIAQRGIEDEEELFVAINEIVDRGIIFQYLDPQKTLLVSTVFLIAIFCTFVAIHAAIDKFFFTEFYRPPKYLLAVRRGLIVCVAILGFVVLHYLAVDPWQSLLAPATVIMVEVAISYGTYRRNKLNALPTTDESQVTTN